MDGCAHGPGRHERLHDELAQRATDAGRRLRREGLNRQASEAAADALARQREAAPARPSLLSYTLPAEFGDAGPLSARWLPPMAGGAGAATFEAAPAGRTHTVDSIPHETVVLGLFDPTRAPVVTVDSGDTIVCRNTLTHFLGAVRPGVPIEEIAALRRAHPGRGPHSILGPIAVRGAEPGDALEVRVLRADPIDYGFNFNNPADLGTGALPDELPEGSVRYFELDRERRTVKWGPHLRLPLAPFQGTLGVAPPVDEPVSSVPPGPYGGNVDLRDQVEGTRIFLPVFKPGALLFTGDSHALQGDGEVNLTAVETAMREVRLQVILHKQAGLTWPIAETPTHWIPLATAPDLDAAFKQCLRNTLAFLGRAAKLSPLDAYGLASIAVSFRVTQVVNVTKGVHALVAKDLFAPDFRAAMHPLGMR